MGLSLEGGCSHEQRQGDEQRVTLLASEVCPALTGLGGLLKVQTSRPHPPLPSLWFRCRAKGQMYQARAVLRAEGGDGRRGRKVTTEGT